MIKVIDVSHHQGTIDWSAVKKALININNGEAGGVIIRVGYSGNSFKVDDQFERNVNLCETLGIPYGFYWYSYDADAKQAAVGAENVIKLIKGRKPLYPVYYDIEYESVHLISSKSQNTQKVIAALEVVEKNGFYAGVYASRNFYTTRLNLEELSRFTLWEAAYVAADTSTIKNDMWQHDSNNSFGIPGFTNLDCNYCYKDFPSIIKATGLNGWKDKIESSDVNWDAVNNDFVVTATGNDRQRLKELCDELSLPVRNGG